jgi:hypothetical protein
VPLRSRDTVLVFWPRLGPVLAALLTVACTKPLPTADQFTAAADTLTDLSVEVDAPDAVAADADAVDGGFDASEDAKLEDLIDAETADTDSAADVPMADAEPPDDATTVDAETDGAVDATDDWVTDTMPDAAPDDAVDAQDAELPVDTQDTVDAADAPDVVACQSAAACADLWSPVEIGPCRQAGCIAKKCLLYPILQGKACADSDPCTIGTICEDGTCVGGDPVTCDDGNPCTDDTCESMVGCVFTANTSTCDDGNACTTADVCAATACAGVQIPCDDGNLCTADGCLPATGLCATSPAAGSCDDGDACTQGEACSQGACVAAPHCDDGNACTELDACAGGQCSGQPKACDDGNPCTTDGCNPAVGCGAIANALPCDDGSPCTPIDACAGGKCLGSGAISCDDANPCSTDACDAKDGCTHAANAAPCSDGNACTMGDTCGPDLKCAGSQALVCDDHHPCTVDSCDPGVGCKATASAGFCPSSVPGLLLWVAGDGPNTLAGNVVAEWQDLSGQKHSFVQATPSRRPSVVVGPGGRPALQLSAAQQQTMTVDVNFPAPVTVLYVARMTGAANARILSGLKNNWLLGWWAGWMDQAFHEGWVTAIGGTAATTLPYAYASVNSGGQAAIYRNGKLIAVGQPQVGVAGPNGLSLSGHVAGSEFSSCVVSEVLVYAGALGPLQRQAVEAWLNLRYKLW